MFESSVDMDKKIEKEQEIYKRIKLLGTGAYGKAYLVKQLKTDQLYVIKQIIMSDMNLQEQENALKQSKILQALSHPNIVRFKEVYRTSKMRLNIVMEYANGGDLASKIKKAKKQNKPFDEPQILDWFTQICLGVKHIHDRKIIHRDLKAQNIFLTEDNIVKIGDFGVSRVLQKTVMNARTVVGSPYYLSPQIIQNKPYSFQTDIWSLGALLYQLCALSPPFTANNLQFLALKIVKGNYGQIPNQYSYDLKSLIKSMLNTDASKRPNINKILTSKVMVKRISNFLTESKRMDEFSHTVIHNKNIFTNNLAKNNPQRQKSLLPPPNLKSMELETQNKSEIYTSNANFQIESPARQRPFTPLIGQNKKGPNNFFNNRKPSKKILHQDTNCNELNLNDLMKIKPSAIEQKIKLPKVNTNPSFFDRKQSEVQINKNVSNHQFQIKQKIISNQAFTKKRVITKQIQLNEPVINTARKQLLNQLKDQQNNNNEIGKWKKAPKMLEKIDQNNLNISPQKQTVDKQSLNIIKQIKIKQEKPAKIVKRSESTKRIVCPTKKPSVTNKKQSEKVKEKKTPNISRKQSRKQSINQANNVMEIISQQAKKKMIQQKEKNRKLSKNKSSSKIDKKKVVPQKSNIALNKNPQTNGVIKKPPSGNKVPKKSNSSKGFQKLSQPPRLQFQNHQDTGLESPEVQTQQEEQKQIRREEIQIMEQQKCNSDLSESQKTQALYSHQQFENYDEQMQEQDNQEYNQQIYSDDDEQKLSLNLSESCRYQQKQEKKQNFNKMVNQLESIQKMIAQANGIIETLPMFGDDLQGKNVLQLSQTSQEIIRQDDSELDSVNNDQENLTVANQYRDLLIQNTIDQKEQMNSNSSESLAGQTNTNLSLLSNQQHLQTLKMNLEQLFGQSDIIFIHNSLSEIIEKQGLDFSQKDTQKMILFQRPQINSILLKKYFRLIVTVIIMEQQQNLVDQ